MRTCRSVIQQALRKTGQLGTADDGEIADLMVALQALQGVYDGYVASGMFGRAIDISHPTDVVIGSRTIRLRIDQVEPVTFTVPSTFDDGCIRAPRNRTLLQVIDANLNDAATLIYDSQRGNWLQLSHLTLDLPAPLSNMGDGLASALAEALSEETGAQVGPMTMRSAARFRSALALKFDSERETVGTEYF